MGNTILKLGVGVITGSVLTGLLAYKKSCMVSEEKEMEINTLKASIKELDGLIEEMTFENNRLNSINNTIETRLTQRNSDIEKLIDELSVLDLVNNSSDILIDSALNSKCEISDIYNFRGLCRILINNSREGIKFTNKNQLDFDSELNKINNGRTENE